MANPRAIGAIFPSSKHLAREMVSHVYWQENCYVIELGAGTGSVTHALMESGIPPQNIIAVEACPDLASELKTRFPEVKVVVGDASHLVSLLDQSYKISTIISSLPLRSLPKNITVKILGEISQLLVENGKFIQFTYSLNPQILYTPAHFCSVRSVRVWLNLPPARVDIFTI